MYLARSAAIENNVFHRIPMASVLLETPDGYYALQNAVGSLTIRNNVFYECVDTLIRSAPQVTTLSPAAGLYGRLMVEDNLLLMREAKPLFLDVQGFRNIKVCRNQIESPTAPAKLARFTDCEFVELLAQRLVGIPGEPEVACVQVGGRQIEN